MNSILEQVYFHNSVRDYLVALATILLGSLILAIIRNVVLKQLKIWAEHTPGTNDDIVIRSIGRFGFAALQYAIIYWGISTLQLSHKAERVVEVVISVVITFFIVRLFSKLILLFLNNRIRKQERGEEKIKQLGGLMLIINMIIWILGIVFLIDNLGGDVTAIVTGLGIGGIAIALAAQNILGDLFNYFVIFFDRPFEVGDFIIVDDKLGTVEYIGIKTTRIRSLSGEQLIMGNSNLTTARIHNYKRMATRRIVFTIDVEYGTPLDTLKEISVLLKSIVLEQKNVTFDRAHFAVYKDWSLRYEVVYIVGSPDFNIYMDIQQAINFRIYEEFTKRKINFAFPTQTSVFKNPDDFKRELEGISDGSTR
ncbi:mechanosensitive ion channel family protein [Chryseosolibacter indicus]|uniref:Mechanosensitive ion channel family protein n=1 Tax=Chryseosolibacter indicus TaxID=2782351 RepID=A0ABS5VMR2_9BACT|nr:mechanosensitive ion channel family protein [Chryseosolibacter indicus]MBT1702738.1 mechanosensitive ion channel family protein [Chryseosolibacter indicus]